MLLTKRQMKNFEKRIDFSDISGCWIWKGARILTGLPYGRFRIGKKTQMVHRIAWTNWMGKIPDDLLVLHKCDNPPCLRPDHLFLGTNQENSNDMFSKKRDKASKQKYCKAGHLLEKPNLDRYFLKKGYRSCRECKNKRQILFYNKHGGQANYDKRRRKKC